MTKLTSDRQARRIQSDKEELADRISRAVTRDGTIQPQVGLHLYRRSAPSTPIHAFFERSFCVIAQGSNKFLLGGQRFRYDAAHYLICTVELPMTGQTVEASRKRSYLSTRLMLDPAVVTSVMIESGDIVPHGAATRAIDVSPLDANVLDATLRLLRLIDTPSEYRALAPPHPLFSLTAQAVRDMLGKPVVRIATPTGRSATAGGTRRACPPDRNEKGVRRRKEKMRIEPKKLPWRYQKRRLC